MESTCVVLVSDYAYLAKATKTIVSLRMEGQYGGPICLIIGNDLHNHEILKQPLFDRLGILFVHFPNLPLPEETLSIMEKLDRPAHWFQKRFQFHKFHVFHPFFKQWKRIFYLDAGLTIFKPIQPILDCWRPNKLLAHSDGFPTFQWRLRNQFVSLSPYIEQLSQRFDLDVNYPQTTILLFDSAILEDRTLSDLYSLLLEFPIPTTNDQAIIALYFTNVKRVWQQIPTGDDRTNYYDYKSRENGKPYIILKIV